MNKLFAITIACVLISGCSGKCIDIEDGARMDLIGTVIDFMDYGYGDDVDELAVIELEGDLCFKKVSNHKNVLLIPFGPTEFSIGEKFEFSGHVNRISQENVPGKNNLNTEIYINFGSWGEVN